MKKYAIWGATALSACLLAGIAPGAVAAATPTVTQTAVSDSLTPGQKEAIAEVKREAALQLREAAQRFQNMKKTIRLTNKDALAALMREITATRMQMRAMEEAGQDTSGIKVHLEYLYKQYKVTKAQGKTELKVLKKSYQRQRQAILDWQEREIERIRSGS